LTSGIQRREGTRETKYRIDEFIRVKSMVSGFSNVIVSEEAALFSKEPETFFDAPEALSISSDQGKWCSTNE
jgi:hypothetical protein